MVFIVEMYGGEPETPDFRFYSCHADVWPRLLALGQAYGWKPAGTALDPIWANYPRAKNFTPDYECEDYGKDVSERDSSALAAALERALRDIRAGGVAPLNPRKPALLRDDMTAEDVELANSDLTPEFLEGFIEFARKGRFGISWDD